VRAFGRTERGVCGTGERPDRGLPCTRSYTCHPRGGRAACQRRHLTQVFVCFADLGRVPSGPDRNGLGKELALDIAQALDIVPERVKVSSEHLQHINVRATILPGALASPLCLPPSSTHTD
jgi:hypothetical protein